MTKPTQDGPRPPAHLGSGRGWPSVVFALALGTAGGALAWRADLPLAWMIGAMTAATVASVAGLPLRLPLRLRSVMVAVLGVMLGSAFTPDLLDRVALWTVSLLALVPYLAVASLLCFVYFRAVAGWDRVTAFFASVPGGLAEMTLIGEAKGGDGRAISLAHAARILLVVSTIPFWFRLMNEAGPAAAVQVARAHIGDVALVDMGLLLAAAVVGAVAGRRLRLPAAMLVGPMVVSAAIHLAGLTRSAPPVEAVAAAQVVLGTAIGCRFAGTAARIVLAAIALAVGALVALLAVAVAFALAVAAATGLGFDALLLAYAPGGLAEMTLVALAQDIDPAFVSTHHVARIALVVTLAPLVFRLLDRRTAVAGRE